MTANRQLSSSFRLCFSGGMLTEHDVGQGSNPCAYAYGLESTDLGVGRDGTPKWNDIGEESEHVDECRSRHTSFSKRAGRLVESRITGCHSSSTVTAFG